MSDSTNGAPDPNETAVGEDGQALLEAPPIDNTELIAAMEAVAGGDTAETREGLYRSLLGATFILPVAAPPTDDGELSLMMLQREDGAHVLPVFTGVEALVAFRQEENVPYVMMAASDVFTMVSNQGPGQDLAINPAGPIGGMISAHDVRLLADGMIPVPGGAAADGQEITMQFGPPAGPLPPDMVDALLAELPKHEVVEAAYVFVAVIGSAPPRLMLGVEFVDGTEEAVMRDTFEPLLQAGKLGLGEADPLDGIPLVGPMLHDIQSAIDALYVKR